MKEHGNGHCPHHRIEAEGLVADVSNLRVDTGVAPNKEEEALDWIRSLHPLRESVLRHPVCAEDLAQKGVKMFSDLLSPSECFTGLGLAGEVIERPLLGSEDEFGLGALRGGDLFLGSLTLLLGVSDLLIFLWCRNSWW